MKAAAVRTGRRLDHPDGRTWKETGVLRSELLIDMVEAEQRGDKQRFGAVVEAVISEERAKQHHLVAEHLTKIVFDHVRCADAYVHRRVRHVARKERAVEYETGEVKRVVSSLLLQIARLPSDVIVVAATSQAN